MYHIYVITNTVNAMQYVGITKNLKKRWYQHRNADGTSRYLHPSIKKYGIENFVFSHIADAFDLDSAKFLEKLLIKEKNTKSPNGYNLTAGGEGTQGFIFSEESKEKMRIAQTGKKMSKESSEKKRIAMLGNKNGLGKKHSEEHKAKIAKAGLGRKHSEESKQKMCEVQKGRKHSPETIAKLTGKKHSPETLEKLRRSHLGKKLSPESIAKRTATLAINRAKAAAAEKETQCPAM